MKSKTFDKICLLKANKVLNEQKAVTGQNLLKKFKTKYKVFKPRIKHQTAVHNTILLLPF